MTVRRTQPEGPSVSRRRPLTAALLASMILLVSCGGDDEKKAEERPFSPDTTGVTSPTPATTSNEPVITPKGTVTSRTTAARPATIRDAREAVDDDNYAAAERTFPALSRAERSDVRTRIANRIARRARAALRRGDRALTVSLLTAGRRYPTTKLARTVRAELRAAEKRLADARRDRLLKAQERARERRQRARAERAARQAREAQRRREQQQQSTTP